MNFSNIIVAVFTLILFNSCKKEIVEIPESNSPIFTVEGQIGDDQVNFVVGDDNSVFTSAIEKINGIDFYNGIMVNGLTEIELGLFRGDNDIASVDINKLVSFGNFSFAELSYQPIFEVNKNYFENSSNIKEIKWFVDGIYAGTNSLSIVNPGKYQVCAQINYNNLPVKTVCNEVLVGFTHNANFELKHTLFENNQLQAWIECPSNTTISKIKWFINDNLVSENLILNANIEDQINSIKAEIEFANGSKRIRTILVDGTKSNGSFEDFAIYENTNVSLWDYKLKLNLKYKGEDFSSINSNNDEGIFKVSSITLLGNDSAGFPVYIFKGVLNAKVESKVTNEILDIYLNISWGLSIK